MREDIDEFARGMSTQFVTHLDNAVEANPDITTAEMGYVVHAICIDMLVSSIGAYGPAEKLEFAKRCMEALTENVLDTLRKMNYGRA